MEKFKEILENKATRIMLLTILVILIIIIIMIVLLGGSGSVTETNLVNAAKSYCADNPGTLPKNNYETKTIMVSTLVSSGYLSEKLNGTECPSYVYVTNMNESYEYNAVLRCSDTATTKLYSKIKKDVVTSGAGLYETNNGYIYKGKDPDNYVSFANSTWRIMGIDENNNVKLIFSSVLQNSYVAWDNRYNSEFIYANSNINAGINNYSKSNLRDYLNKVFDEYSDKFTSERIARITTHDVCTGSVVIGAGSKICSTKEEDTYVSIITISDYIKASLDSNCSSTNSKYCQNDNYLHTVNNNCWTITADGSNSYSAFYIDQNDGIKSAWSYIQHCTRPVITLKSDVLYVSGNGTVDNPYKIG